MIVDPTRFEPEPTASTGDPMGDSQHYCQRDLPTLPDAVIGTAYTQALMTTGGTGPYTYTVEVGSLPQASRSTEVTSAAPRRVG